MTAAPGRINPNVSDLPSSAGLNTLRNAAAQKDPGAIDATAKQFESLFAQQMIKTMREASGSDAMFPGDSKTYRDLYDRELANRLTQGKGLGMQAMIKKALGANSPATIAPHANLKSTTTASTLSATTNSTPTTTLPHPRAAAMSLAKYTRNLPVMQVTPTSARNAATLSTTPPTSAVSPTTSTDATAVKPTQAAAQRLPQQISTVQTTSSRGSGRLSPLPPSDANLSPPTSRGAPNRSLSQEDFVAQVWPHAQRAAAALGIAPQALVAQAALESGWGKHVSGDNNLFGIKAGSSWTGATKSLTTSEFSNGQLHQETAHFRSYTSIGDSFDDYVNVLKNSPRYAGVLGSGFDTQRFASALQKAGYATDPNYAAKISSIAHGSMIASAVQKSGLQNSGAGPLLASR